MMSKVKRQLKREVQRIVKRNVNRKVETSVKGKAICTLKMREKRQVTRNLKR